MAETSKITPFEQGCNSTNVPVRKTPFVAPFLDKNDDLPRQAQDRHGENSKKKASCAGAPPERLG
jgi:hypothetical protein